MSNHQKLVEAFRKAMFVDHDPAAIRELYTEEATLLDPGLAEPLRGNAAIAEYHAGFLRAFPDLSAETLNLFGSGDWFVGEFRVRGTHSGPLELEPGHTVPATGKGIDLRVCWVGRVAPDGRCAEDHSYYDTSVFTRLAAAQPAA
jgi:hypothetical protein